MNLKALAILIVIANGLAASAQIYDTNGDFVQTFAGSGQSGFSNGVGQQATFNYPMQVVADSKSNLFVWDASNAKIRKIAPDSTVTTFASVGLGSNGKLTIDRSDNIFAVSGDSPFYLYKFSSNGTFTRTNLNFISSMSPLGGFCVDSTGNFYISDQNASTIYQCDTNGLAMVFAGSGNPGYADLNGTNAAFSAPQSLACDAADNIYVWDRGNYAIRRIDQNQNVTTYAGHAGNGNYPSADGIGTNAVFSGPQAIHFGGDAVNQMCCDRLGNLFLACCTSVRKISASTNVTTLAGSFTEYSFTSGPGNLARFNGANGICIVGGTIYVADSDNQRIRSITNNPPPQVVSGANLGIGTFAGVTITGIVGRTYQIQSSPDLNAWTTQATVLLTSSPYLWIDQNPIAGNKFYQAVMLP